MDRQTVVERKTRLDGTEAEYRCAGLLLEPGKRAVLRYVLEREAHVGSLAMPPGTVTVAHYWVDRPYNAYHWLSEGRTLAYYCNVADRISIEAGLVAWRDLVVDALLLPGGALEILDEDELPTDLDPALRKTIADAVEVFVTNAKRLTAEVEKETRRLL